MLANKIGLWYFKKIVLCNCNSHQRSKQDSQGKTILRSLWKRYIESSGCTQDKFNPFENVTRHSTVDDRHIETAYGSKVEDRCLTRESPFSGKLQYRSGVVTCYQRTGNYYRGTAIESALWTSLVYLCFWNSPYSWLSAAVRFYLPLILFTSWYASSLAKRRLTVEDLSSRFPLRTVWIFIWLLTRVLRPCRSFTSLENNRQWRCRRFQ